MYLCLYVKDKKFILCLIFVVSKSQQQTTVITSHNNKNQIRKNKIPFEIEKSWPKQKYMKEKTDKSPVTIATIAQIVFIENDRKRCERYGCQR